MEPPTEQGRAAAFVVTALVFSGVVVGTIIPNIVRTKHVEFGTWPQGTDFESVRCIEGAVHIADGPVRTLGKLPSVTDSGGPYCTYRACFTPDQIPAGDVPSMPDASMDPLFADQELAWQSPWPPLEVWCNDQDSSDNPTLCACVPEGVTTCEKLVYPDGGAAVWAPASWGDTMGANSWRGNACLTMPCTRLAGKDDAWVPAACCKPACAERSCGSDGCGGSCGTCTSNLTCDAGAGRCCSELPCTPERTPSPR